MDLIIIIKDDATDLIEKFYKGESIDKETYLNYDSILRDFLEDIDSFWIKWNFVGKELGYSEEAESIAFEKIKNLNEIKEGVN